jgi:hypothetical protein
MVQLENESGSIGSVQDYSPTANELFSGPVPQKLVAALHKQPNNWQQIFGGDAEEALLPTKGSTYINQVAAAGKAEYALPIYCNNWLHYPNGDPRSYPSGGPTYNMLEVWKAAPPSIDLIGPDIYISNTEMYRKVLQQFHRPDNPIWIPETLGFQMASPVFLFYALDEEAIGYSPFGLDSMPVDAFAKHLSPQPDGLAANYSLLGSMDRRLAELLYQGEVKTAVEEPMLETTALDFGKWKAVVSFSPCSGNGTLSPIRAGRVLIANDSPEIVTDPLMPHVHTEFQSLQAAPRRSGANKVEECK